MGLDDGFGFDAANLVDQAGIIGGESRDLGLDAAWVRLRRSRSISQAPKVSSFETCETSMKMLGRLPRSFSASVTICSSMGAKRAVHEPAAHSASPLPWAIRSSVGSPLTMPTPRPARQ